MNFALIGYGEVGRILSEDLRAAGHAVTVFDLKLATSEGDSMRAHAQKRGTTLAKDHASALKDAQIVISAVTASQTVGVAESCAGAFSSDTFFLDFNSASPGAKVRAAALITTAGGRFVEAAVMTSVPPHRLKVPLLLGGPHASALEPLLKEVGFVARVVSPKLGVASATKMCRSMVIKGLEALMIESLVSARHYGVEDDVLASLRETFPGLDWEKQSSYFFQRVIEHGRRRSEEMREVAVTVRDVRLKPWNALGTAERQDWMADLAEDGVFGDRAGPNFARSPDWRVEADRILEYLLPENDG